MMIVTCLRAFTLFLLLDDMRALTNYIARFMPQKNTLYCTTVHNDN